MGGSELFNRNRKSASKQTITVLIKIRFDHTAAGLAQSVERLIAERKVAGSIPGGGPTLRPDQHSGC